MKERLRLGRKRQEIQRYEIETAKMLTIHVSLCQTMGCLIKFLITKLGFLGNCRLFLIWSKNPIAVSKTRAPVKKEEKTKLREASQQWHMAKKFTVSYRVEYCSFVILSLRLSAERKLLIGIYCHSTISETAASIPTRNAEKSIGKTSPILLFFPHTIRRVLFNEKKSSSIPQCL